MLKKLTVLMVFSLGLNSNASANQISDYPELSDLFIYMDDSMDKTNVYFTYETQWDSLPCTPKAVSRDVLVNEFVDVVNLAIGAEFSPEGVSSSVLAGLIEPEVNQFLALLGSEPYFTCQGSEAGFMTEGRLTYFGSKNFEMVFEFGYED